MLAVPLGDVVGQPKFTSMVLAIVALRRPARRCPTLEEIRRQCLQFRFGNGAGPEGWNGEPLFMTRWLSWKQRPDEFTNSNRWQ